MDKSKLNKIVSDRDQEKNQKLNEEIKLAEQFNDSVIEIYKYVLNIIHEISDDKLQEMLEKEVEAQCKEDIPSVLKFEFHLGLPLIKIDDLVGEKLKIDAEWYQLIERFNNSKPFVLFDYRPKAVVNPVKVPTLLNSVNEFKLLDMFKYLISKKLIIKNIDNYVEAYEKALTTRLEEFGLKIRKCKTKTNYSIGTYIISFLIKVENPIDYRVVDK